MSQTLWLKRSFDALSRRKVFRAAAAYAVPAWLLVQVADTLLEAFGGDEAHMRLLIFVLLAGFPVVLILAWIYDLRDGRLTRTGDDSKPPSRAARVLDFVIVGACAVGVGYFLLNADRVGSPQAPGVAADPADAAPRSPSVAVLPFQNNSDDPANAIFADGLAEDVLIRLSKIERLRVPGRTSSFKYKEGPKDLAAIGQALNVRAILEGSVQAYEGMIKVSASLVDAADSAVLWSDSYTREMTNVFAIQEEIARAVADSLKIELLGETVAQVTRPTESVDAYRLYLRGRNEWHKRTSASNARAIDLFERALALDDQYAHAWSGLADAYGFASNYGNMAAEESIRRAREAAERALELDPELPEAYASLGLVLSDEGRFEESAQAYGRAIELNPNFANAHMWLGSVLAWVDTEGATRERRIAAELEPLSPIAVQLYGEMLYRNGQVDEARREYLKILDFAPDYPLVYFELAEMALAKSDYVGAIQYLRKANELDPGRAATLVSLTQLYTFLGELQTANEWLARAIEIGPDQQQVKSQQLAMMEEAGDYDGMVRFISSRLQSDADFFPAYLFTSVVAFEREDYATAALWIRRIFARFTGIEVEQIDDTQLLLHEDTIAGISFLANAERRDGNAQTAEILGQRMLTFLDERRERNLFSPNDDIARVGAHLAVGDLDAAVATVREMADGGFPGYRRLENDRLFQPIRSKLEFKLSVDDMRENARRYLDKLGELES